MNVLSWVDFVMVPLWLIIIYAGATFIKRTRYKNDPTARFLLPALTLKVLGGIMLGLAYQYYYSGGDTISYFVTARSIVLVAFENIDHGFTIFNADFDQSDFRASLLINQYEKAGLDFPYWGDRHAFNVSRFIVFANLLTFNSYYAGTMIVSSFSFIGMWAMFRVFYRQYPAIGSQLAFAVFYIPSVFFWGSGILKDPITLGLLGILTFCSYQIISGKKDVLLSILLILFASYFIYSIKPYILLSFIPFIAIWYGTTTKGRIKNPLIKFAFGPFIIIIILSAAYLALSNLGSGRFAIDRVFETALITQKDLTSGYYYSDAKGSSYNIGEFDETIASQIRLFPNAVFTTFYRPVLWEIRNPLMFLASMESTLLFVFTLFIIFRCGLMNFIVVIYKRPFLLFCFGYSLAFAFMIGLTSGNFGNLVRYKIPCIPFFVGTLIIAQYLILKNRNQLSMQWQRPKASPLEAKKHPQ